MVQAVKIQAKTPEAQGMIDQVREQIAQRARQITAERVTRLAASRMIGWPPKYSTNVAALCAERLFALNFLLEEAP